MNSRMPDHGPEVVVAQVGVQALPWCATLKARNKVRQSRFM
jgi:hypothetical protein